MKRAWFVATFVILLVALVPGMVRAEYAPGWIPPNCGGADSFQLIGDGMTTGAVPAGFAGNLIRAQNVGSFRAQGMVSGTDYPVVAGFSSARETSDTDWAENYWTNGVVASEMVIFVSFLLRHTGGSSSDSVDIRASFENQTLTLANTSGVFTASAVSWYNPTTAGGIPATAYAFVDATNWVNLTQQVSVRQTDATCTGGDMGTYSRAGSVAAQAGPYNWMAFPGGAAPPGPPVPSVANGTALGCSVFALNWSAPENFPNLTSYRVYRNSSVYPVNRTFHVPPEGNFSLRLLNDTYPKISAALAYSVVGVNASGGASPPSNVVNFTPPAISSVGDCGLAFGGMAKSEFLELAGLSGASEDALGILLSIVLVLAGAGAGFAIMAAGGAAMGAAAGMLLSVALGYLPLWAIMFSLGLLVGGYFISKPGAGRRRGK